MAWKREPDRLAITTYVECGDEVAVGEPGVTDGERAAAGRESLAERRVSRPPGTPSGAARERHSGLRGR